MTFRRYLAYRLLGAAAVLAILVFFTEYVLQEAGPQVNFQTLRVYLAKVHVAPGYAVTTTRADGTNCHPAAP